MFYLKSVLQCIYEIIKIICGEKLFEIKKVGKHELLVFKYIFRKSEDIARSLY